MRSLFKITPIISVLVMGLYSCGETIDIVVNDKLEQPEVRKINAYLNDYVHDNSNTKLTRTTIVTDTDNNLQLVWADNDTIGIFPDQGSQVAFSMSSAAGAKSASFDGGGWGLKNSSTYSAYYPLIGQFYLDKTKIPMVMHSQTQTGNGTFAHVGKADYMAAANSQVNANGGVDFAFQPLTCLLRMQVKMPHGGKYKYVALEASGEFTTEATLDLTTGSISAKKKSPLQVLTLKDIELNNNEENPILDFYLSILPVDLTGKVISAKIFDDENNCYTVSMQAKNFVAGTIYTYQKIATPDITHTGLPITLINTPENVNIVDKENYINNTYLSVLQTEIMDEFCELTNIKGRGNTTWKAPKKPYALKFDKKKSILNLPEDKSWVLLANYYDATLLRNDLAFYIGKEMSTLDWTPHYQQVDLMLNGQYKGIYQLGEKVKIANKRVNVGDDGFLMEIDQRALTESDARYFNVTHLPNPVNIKDPEVEYDDDNYNYVKEYVLAADAVLYSDDFKDAENGWQKYMDIDSFVDWYLINEISKNGDACALYSSCYMNLKRGGKLKMGPLWDYDIGFGGYPAWNLSNQSLCNNPENFYLKNQGWFIRLFEDPAFVAKVKERFNYYYENRQMIYDRIDAGSTILKDKIVEDNKLWETICSNSATTEEVKTAYQEKVDYLKNWIATRLEWLNTNINAL